MKFTTEVLHTGKWRKAGLLYDAEQATNDARSWLARGYRVRLVCELAGEA